MIFVFINIHCTHVTIMRLTNHLVEDSGIDSHAADIIINKYSAVKELYDIKFDQLWKTFEKVCAEYHGKGE